MSGPTPSLKLEIVRAGAGAGKTTTLVDRVLATVAEGRAAGRWPRMVVTTFTRKATQELRERLTIKACEQRDLELLDYCRSRSRLQISTIHGVLGMFLRRYGHLLGLDPNYSILTERGAQRLSREVLRDCLRGTEGATELLNEYGLGRLLTILSDFVERAAAYDDFKPWDVNELRMSQEASARSFACEAGRLASELSGVSRPSWQEYGRLLERIASVAQGPWNEETWAKLQSLRDAWPARRPARKGVEAQVSAELDERVGDLNDRLKSWLDNPAFAPSFAARLADRAQQLESLAHAYAVALEAEKRARGVLTMADLELFAIAGLRRHPGVGEAFSADWDFWLIDEFQDTAPIQVELLDALIGERRRFIVGDPQQSIYLFRGARVEVFTREEQRLKSLGGEPLLKMRNFRSDPSLLAFFNDFFAALAGDFYPMSPRSEEFNPDRVVATFFAAAPDGDGSRSVEYGGILAHIERLTVEQGVELGDICILGRKNRHLLDIAQFLKERGYPTHVHAARGYFQRREVRDALALLKFMIHPWDDHNLLTLLRSPWCRLGDDILARLASHGEGGYWQRLIDSELRAHAVVARLAEIRREAENIGFALGLERALIRFGFFDFSSHHDATGRREANLWKLLANLTEAQRRPGFNVLEFIAQAADTVEDDERQDEGDAVTALEPNVINLMTIHAAKGLEHEHVIIPHCDEGPKPRGLGGLMVDEETHRWLVALRDEESGEWIYPHFADGLKSVVRERELAEADRLLYVALTRAKQSVMLSWTAGRQKSAGAWTSRWHWPTEVSGVVRRDKYSFEVLHELKPKGLRRDTRAEAATVRSLWQKDSLLAGGPTSISVVGLVEESARGAAKGEPAGAPAAQLSDRLEKAVLGTDLHRLFEQMRLNPERDLSALARTWFPRQAERVLKALAYVRSLKSPPMAELLAKGQAEWGFQLKRGDAILEGQIDLWGESSSGLWVVDYKSGDPRFVEKAFHQLTIYAFALKRFGFDTTVNLAVIFPFAERTEIRTLNSVPDLDL